VLGVGHVERHRQREGKQPEGGRDDGAYGRIVFSIVALRFSRAQPPAKRKREPRCEHRKAEKANESGNGTQRYGSSAGAVSGAVSLSSPGADENRT